MAKQKKMPKGNKVKRIVEFKLTDEEKAAKGLRAAELSQEIGKVSIQKKIAADEFSAKLKDRTGRMSTLLAEIHKGTEGRETECIEFKNYEDQKVEYWFDGAKVQERDMTDHDRQLDLKTDTKSKRNWQKAEDTEIATPSPFKPTAAEKKKSEEIKQVHREETGRNTAYSQLNGARQ